MRFIWDNRNNHEILARIKKNDNNSCPNCREERAIYKTDNPDGIDTWVCFFCESEFDSDPNN